ncbi:tetratricopeptide repeat protein [Phenylobacterium sp.]|uniref:tetratricopeptide repeat protein n=1 Tax=Phenylobacterium sp. TaxID=1871053 RepID=UPI003BAD5F47
MQQRDLSGAILSGASPAAAEKYLAAVEAYHCFAGDAGGLLEAAIADSPAFTMAHVLKAYLHLVGSNAAAVAVGVEAATTALALPATDREQGHLAGLRKMLAGEYRAAGRIFEDLTIAHPKDALGLQVGQLMDFLTGDSRMLRDRIGRAAPQWDQGRPDYHAVLGMLAFGLEETGHYDRAEAAGRQAVALQPRNGWAQHAVAHVLEMQDRRADGVTWMRADIDAWTRESFFAVHNWWHLALFHLGLGEVDEVLKLYDGPIWGAKSDMSFDMVDASALLWRLSLRGMDLGNRWNELADVYEARAGTLGAYAFDDTHAMLAFVGAGRSDAARDLLAIQQAALKGAGDNASFAGEVGLPVMEGLVAFGAGDYGRAVERLRDVRNRSARFGGSHAQRDLLDLTLIEAATRNKDHDLRRALIAERAVALPAGEKAGALGRAA